MTKTRFLALLTALALLLTIPTVLFAQSSRPHVFIGTATLDGAPAVDGTAVTAWVGGTQITATNVVNGRYRLQVVSDDGFAGQTVDFRIGAADADQSADWVEGEAEVLNLTASSSNASTEPPAPGGEGAKGDKGDTGAAGATGPQGSAGATGPAGSAGATGATGATGAAGSPGNAGVAGDDGGGGAIGIIALIALIVAIVALVAAGGAYMMGRRT